MINNALHQKCHRMKILGIFDHLFIDLFFVFRYGLYHRSLFCKENICNSQDLFGIDVLQKEPEAQEMFALQDMEEPCEQEGEVQQPSEQEENEEPCEHEQPEDHLEHQEALEDEQEPVLKQRKLPRPIVTLQSKAAGIPPVTGLK